MNMSTLLNLEHISVVFGSRKGFVQRISNAERRADTNAAWAKWCR
ncbi:Uncharacterised protein [Budvicia aquatica]|uniref:Uncharacterized protein n=1 Tax=Budvicia aquatica TaxID=82979 RepID=A0A484ZQN3_9GAMM|nr:Uncharacterised protein [Budvicia aquatica]